MWLTKHVSWLRLHHILLFFLAFVFLTLVVYAPPGRWRPVARACVRVVRRVGAGCRRSQRGLDWPPRPPDPHWPAPRTRALPRPVLLQWLTQWFFGLTVIEMAWCYIRWRLHQRWSRAVGWLAARFGGRLPWLGALGARAQGKKGL